LVNLAEIVDGVGKRGCNNLLLLYLQIRILSHHQKFSNVFFRIAIANMLWNARIGTDFLT